MIYFENEYCVISWDAELDAVVNYDKGVYRQAEKYRLTMNKVCDALVTYKTKKLLANIQKLKVVDQADQDWLINVWYPQLVRLGLKYNAIIAPESSITRLAVKKIDPVVNDTSIQRKYFSNEKEARDWLLSLNKV